MATQKPTTPTVHIARVSGRPLQLWYKDANGRKVRRSTGTHDPQQAEQQRRELEARLLLDIPATATGAIAGPSMRWQDFREAYSRVQQHKRSVKHIESRLDLAERIVRPRTLQDMADNLDKLQDGLLRGVASQTGRPRATSTVRYHMVTVRTALLWATRAPRRWLESVPRVDVVSLEEADDMRGRPLCAEETDRFFAAIPKVVGEQAAPSWEYLLRAVLASGLRLDEIMHVSWDIPGTIMPIWSRGRLPVLFFPAVSQKNKQRESIPLIPWLESVLLETPEARRTGWCFEPMSLQYKAGRTPRTERLKTDRVGKVICKIGQRAGIIVEQGNPRTGSSCKYASCHDLRRTFATNLHESNLDPQLIRTLMRHADIKTTERYYLVRNTQTEAGRIAEALAGTGFQVTKCDPDCDPRVTEWCQDGKRPVSKPR